MSLTGLNRILWCGVGWVGWRGLGSGRSSRVEGYRRRYSRCNSRFRRGGGGGAEGAVRL